MLHSNTYVQTFLTVLTALFNKLILKPMLLFHTYTLWGRHGHDCMIVGFTTTTINSISVISWLSVLLVEETGVPEDNHRPVSSH
jgi:hypothetical protein